jgi:hypothetical protein
MQTLFLLTLLGILFLIGWSLLNMAALTDSSADGSTQQDWLRKD